MSMLAAIRPDDVNLPLFLHVLGAMLLVGALFAVGLATVIGWRRPDDAAGLTRLGLRTVLMGVLPAWILMRIGALWTQSEENFPEGFEPDWLGIGYVTADVGAILILVAIVLSVIGLRKLRSGTGVGAGRAAGVISIVLLAAYLVAVWAMSAKPS
ncbi:MAG: hypothetical protein ACRDNB_08830 [Gaiellaceae bacterium]